MLGYGGGQGETWGTNTIAGTNWLVSVTGYTYESLDFSANYSATGGDLITGDSGGGDFIFGYDPTTGEYDWQLAGINEAIDDSGNSYMVNLSDYLTTVPEPCSWASIAVGGLLILGVSRLRGSGGWRVACLA